MPVVARGTCGGRQAGVSLVYTGHTSRLAAKVDSEDACAALCDHDAKCNFWTWHDSTTGKYYRDCYVREDAVYDVHPESGRSSGVCNHTLPAPSPLGGLHGASVGAMLVDLLPQVVHTKKLRFRCTASIAPDGSAALKSFSVHVAQRPVS